MDNNEASRKEFEAWFVKELTTRHNCDLEIAKIYLKKDDMGVYVHPNTFLRYEGWQAAQQQSAGEIAEYKKALKAALEEKDQARHDEELAYKHYHELKADNERLREALERLKIGTCSCFTKTDQIKFHRDNCTYKIASEALSATSTQSLQAHDGASHE